jgi:hypothetical protein
MMKIVFALFCSCSPHCSELQYWSVHWMYWYLQQLCHWCQKWCFSGLQMLHHIWCMHLG